MTFSRRQVKATQELALSMLEYDKETGVVSRKFDITGGGRGGTGKTVGCTDRNGYLLIGMGGRHYVLHRIIWLMVYGYLPEHQIDHINRVKDDNRICNLREVTQSCNMRNSKPRNHSTGVKGVHKFIEGTSWRAVITIDGRRIDLGVFTDLDDAICHRLAAEQCIGWHTCDKYSSAEKYVASKLQKRA